jgi:trans-aconitate methyltransferase
MACAIHDIPCGDFNWMPDVLAEFPGVAYVGFDIVRAALERNRRRHPGVTFRALDITAKPPPPADLIFCKDLFNHLSDADVRRALLHMRGSGSTYLLASNNPGHAYAELPDDPAGSRHLDLTAPPFGYGPPLWTLGGYMSLWRLADMVEREC